MQKYKKEYLNDSILFCFCADELISLCSISINKCLHDIVIKKSFFILKAQKTKLFKTVFFC